MPSQEQPPTLQRLIEAFHTGAGLQDTDADNHPGSLYEHIGGPAALLWRRLVERTRAGFRENYRAHASRRLDQHIERRSGRPRVQDVPGEGTIQVSRATAAAGEGWFRVGTRFLVGVGSSSSKLYEVRSDTPVSSTDLTATVPVRAMEPGPVGKISTSTAEGASLAWADSVWDSTWQIDSIECAAGTLRESDADYRDAERDRRFDERPGYPTSIEAALRALGATQVEFFPSDFAGDELDLGLNMVVVGDEGFETSAEVLRDCRLALDGVTIAGTAVQIVPMTRVVWGADITIRLFDLPERFDTLGVRQAARGAVLEYFRGRQNPFIWQEEPIRSAIYRAVRNVSSITIQADATEPVLSGLFTAPPLKRYVAEPYSVTVVVLGPGS